MGTTCFASGGRGLRRPAVIDAAAATGPCNNVERAGNELFRRAGGRVSPPTLPSFVPANVLILGEHERQASERAAASYQVK